MEERGEKVRCIRRKKIILATFVIVFPALILLVLVINTGSIKKKKGRGKRNDFTF